MEYGDEEVLEVDEGDAVAVGEVHGFLDEGGIVSEPGLADGEAGAGVGEAVGAGALGDADGGEVVGVEGDRGGGEGVGDGAGIGQAVVEGDRSQAEVVHDAVEVGVSDQVEEPVEGLVIGHEGQFSDFAADGDGEVAGVEGLGGVAGEERFDFEGCIEEGAGGVGLFQVLEGEEAGDGGAELDAAGGVEVFGVDAEAVAEEGGLGGGVGGDRGDEELEAVGGGVMEDAGHGRGRVEEEGVHG